MEQDVAFGEGLAVDVGGVIAGVGGGGVSVRDDAKAGLYCCGGHGWEALVEGCEGMQMNIRRERAIQMAYLI